MKQHRSVGVETCTGVEPGKSQRISERPRLARQRAELLVEGLRHETAALFEQEVAGHRQRARAYGHQDTVFSRIEAPKTEHEFRAGAHLLSDFALKFSIVDVNMLSSILFQPFYILAREEDLKAVNGKREEDDPTHSCVLRLEFSVGDEDQ